MCGCSGGAGPCMVAPGGAWLLQGGMRGCSGGHAWLLGGACMVALGGHAWLLWGGMPGFIRRACMVLFKGIMRGFIRGGMRGFFSFSRYNEIRSMSGRYASYWNAFLYIVILLSTRHKTFAGLTRNIPQRRIQIRTDLTICAHFVPFSCQPHCQLATFSKHY